MRRIIGGVVMVSICGAMLMVAGGATPLSAQEKKAKAGTTTQGKTATKTETKTEPVPLATWVITKDAKGNYRFKMMMDDTTVCMTTKGFETKEECLKMVDTIQKAAAKAKIDDQSKATTDKK